MDIKSKNKCNIKYAVIVSAVFLSAFIMVGLCPYFGKKAEEVSQQYYLEEDEQLIQTLAESCYVLYRDAQNQESPAPLSPVQLFLPGTTPETLSANEDPLATEQESDDYEIRELENRLLGLYQNWETNWYSQRKAMDYQVIGHENGQVVMGNQQEYMSESNYVIFADISYDEKGNAAVSQVKGVGDDQQVQNMFLDYLHQNPLNNYYNSQTRYDSRYAFVKPASFALTFGMTQEQVNSFISDNSRGSYWDELPYRQSGLVMNMVICLSLFLFGLAFFIPVVDKTVTGNEWYSKGFIEAAVIAGTFALFNQFHVTLISDINHGLWETNLLEAGFMPFAAKFLVISGSLLWWLAIFFVIFWASSCLLSIRTLTPCIYLRQRSIAYRILFYMRTIFTRAGKHIYELIVYADRSDESHKAVFRVVLINFFILAAICSAWFFGLFLLVIYSIILYVILQKYFMNRKSQYKSLLKATNAIAEGNLDVEIKEDLGTFEPFKVEIQKIQQGFKKAVNEEVKSQRMKTDLISNVSHDLKTPLTAIITYVNLLKDESITPEQRQSYVDVLDSKSMRLKVLIEDIFEISKATSQNVTLNLVDIDIVSLLKQVRLELEDQILEANLDFRWKLPDAKLILALDSQKTFRIFENLLLNILKYALPGTRVYIDMGVLEGEVVVSMKNVSTAELTSDPNDMTERFLRGDQARNTEGSGLGLAIVKSFVELQKGKLELEADGDLFKVTIRWKLGKQDT